MIGLGIRVNYDVRGQASLSQAELFRIDQNFAKPLNPPPYIFTPHTGTPNIKKKKSPTHRIPEMQRVAMAAVDTLFT